MSLVSLQFLVCMMVGGLMMFRGGVQLASARPQVTATDTCTGGAQTPPPFDLINYLVTFTVKTMFD